MGEVKKARNFRNYKVWQDAVDYATKVYKVTIEMPWFEKKGLCDQLQRAVVSISSNIAEGAAKPSDIEFAHFLDTALGSAFEVETQLLIAKNIGYIKNLNDNLNANDNLNLNLDVDLNGNGNRNLNDNGNGNGNGNGSVTYEELLEGIDDIEHQLAALIKTLRQ
jgi:four helix bundle protein